VEASVGARSSEVPVLIQTGAGGDTISIALGSDARMPAGCARCWVNAFPLQLAFARRPAARVCDGVTLAEGRTP